MVDEHGWARTLLDDFLARDVGVCVTDALFDTVGDIDVPVDKRYDSGSRLEDVVAAAIAAAATDASDPLNRHHALERLRKALNLAGVPASIVHPATEGAPA